MMIAKTPDTTNQILKDNNGFVSGGNFVWGKSTILGLNQLYVSPSYSGPVTDLGVSKAKEYLDQGYCLLAEVDFNPATIGEDMHFVAVIGYDGDNFTICDPWTGTECSMDVYGGFRRGVIQFRVYDKKFPQAQAPEGTVAVQKSVFENLVRKSTLYDKVLVKLNVNDNETVVIGELDKLISYEDALMVKEKEKSELQKQIEELQIQLTSKSLQLDEMKLNNEELQKDIKAKSDELTVQALEHQQTIQSMDIEIKNVQKALQELKDQSQTSTPVLKYSWQKWIYKLITL